jgi:nucleoside-diphosphate-sugar epimerase
VAVITRGQKPVPREYQSFSADRANLADMKRIVDEAKPDVVINFLGFATSDVMLDFQLFQGAVAQYIFVSSATVYAKPHRVLPLPETAPQGNPWSEYARHKQACEEWLMERSRSVRFPVTIVRPSHTYSKSWIPNLVNSSSFSFALRMERGAPVFVPDKGDGLWTLTAASDFATGLAGLVGQHSSLGQAYNITSDEILTWNQIYAEIAAAMGVKEPQIKKVPLELICAAAPELVAGIKGDKAQAGVFDNAKIKRAVPGFKCRKPFREGVREAVEWLRGHPWDQNLDPKVDRVIDRVMAEYRRQSDYI